MTECPECEKPFSKKGLGCPACNSNHAEEVRKAIGKVHTARYQVRKWASQLQLVQRQYDDAVASERNALDYLLGSR